MNPVDTVQENISLQPFNTLSVDVNAHYFCQITHQESLQKIITDGKWLNMPKLVLGGGSNILFVRDFSGLVLHNAIKGKYISKETKEHLFITVGGGENWHEFVMYCVENGYSGIENLSLIPGTVGAAPVQNIGAYGVELEEVLQQLVAIDLTTGEAVTFESGDCQFAYRDSVFKHVYKDRFFISEVTFKLAKKLTPKLSYAPLRARFENVSEKEITLKAISEAVIAIRNTRLPDPKILPNAGSFFKNPLVDSTLFNQLVEKHGEIPHYSLDNGQTKIPAAWLIEQCGLKAKREGEVGTYEHHALVICNYGMATGQALALFANHIRESVLDKFDIELIPEVRLL